MKDKIHLLLVLLWCFPIFSYSQNDSISEGANSITIPELKDHMYYLASDELDGRLPGTSGYKKAAEYAVTQFKQSGLVPIVDNGTSFLQPVPLRLYYWDEKNELILNNSTGRINYRIGEDFIIHSGEPYESRSLSGEMVFVSMGIQEPEHGFDNYKGIDVKGKWVIMYSGYYMDELKEMLPPDTFSKYKERHNGQRLREEYARKAGAIGIIIIPHKFDFDFWDALADSRRKQVKLRNFKNQPFNSEITSLLANERLISEIFKGHELKPLEDKLSLKSFPLEKITLDFDKNFYTEDIVSYNVIGLVKGSTSTNYNKYITVGAHLDHMGIQNGEIINGADDNASGSVGVIEMAEAVAMSKSGHPVIFILYTAEEMGLLGSWYFTENPPVSMDNIIANINLDMLGRSDGDVEKGICPIILDTTGNELKKIILNVHHKYPVTDLDWTYADTCRYRSSSDHYSFHTKGVPSVFFFDGTNPDIHTPKDDAVKIDYEYFQKNCEFVYHLIMELANASIEETQFNNRK